MTDFENLNADYNYILTKHFSEGRDGESVQYVGIHHMVGNLSLKGCYNTWLNREASAHYAVDSSGNTAQYVWDKNTAWALGNWTANCRSINIEMPNDDTTNWTVYETALDVGAHLAAAICKKYSLGNPTWLKNMYPHNYFRSTTCPGQLYGTQKTLFQTRARKWYSYMNGGEKPCDISEESSSTSSSSSSSSSTSSSSSIDLGTDLTVWGPKFTKALQTQRGTTVDGVVSSQPKTNKTYNTAVQSGTFEWVTSASGSKVIKSLQNMLIKAGYSCGSDGADGMYGKNTIKAHQRWLNAKGYSVGSSGVDGYHGPDTNSAMAKALKASKYQA